MNNDQLLNAFAYTHKHKIYGKLTYSSLSKIMLHPRLVLEYLKQPSSSWIISMAMFILLKQKNITIEFE